MWWRELETRSPATWVLSPAPSQARQESSWNDASMSVAIHGSIMSLGLLSFI